MGGHANSLSGDTDSLATRNGALDRATSPEYATAQNPATFGP